MFDDKTNIVDCVAPPINDRIGLMFETSFTPIATPVCLSSSLVAHQGSVPGLSAATIELKDCQEDDDLPAKSSTSEENEEESPLSSPMMEMASTTATSPVAIDRPKSPDPPGGGSSTSI